MRQRIHRLAIVVGTFACLVAAASDEAGAQMSKVLEFGPYAIDMERPGRAAEVTPLAASIEPEAGTWRPWILSSGRELRLPPPPDERSTAREQREVRKLAVGSDAAALERVRYWNAGSPAYRWNEMLTKLALGENLGSVDGIRALAILNVAIHDATIAAWDSKYSYRRPRPRELDGRLAPAVTVPLSPSYPCEHAVTAGAAAVILAYLFPAHAEHLAAAAHEAARSRIEAGAVYPSDVDAGLALGRAVAVRVIESVKTRGIVSLGIQSTLAADLARVRSFERASFTNGWSSGWALGEVPMHRWLNEEISRRLTEAALDGNAPRAARAYALAHVTHYAAFMAFRATTFRHLAPLPDRFGQTITMIVPITALPSHPSSAAASGFAATLVLDHLFQTNAPRHPRSASELTHARLWGGRQRAGDVDAGLEIGRRVAEGVIEWARHDGAE